jgi:hypothetical protein
VSGKRRNKTNRLNHPNKLAKKSNSIEEETREYPKKKRNPQSTKNSNRKLISEIKTHIYIYKVAFIISKYEIAKKKKKSIKDSVFQKAHLF